MFSFKSNLFSKFSVYWILITGDKILHACFLKLDIFGNVKNIGISDSVVKEETISSCFVLWSNSLEFKRGQFCNPRCISL